MKCVMLNTKEVIRVKNSKAMELVEAGRGKYCPKSIYKDVRRIITSTKRR